MKTRMSAAVLVAFLAGCGQSVSPGASDNGAGRARLLMTGTGSDGVTYHLVGWSLRFDGPTSMVLPESDAEPVTVSLKAGAYTVALDGDWHVERTDAPGVPVKVVLVSPNPLGFVVRADEDTTVRFLFKLTLEGSATVTMGVDAGGWIAGTFTLDQWGDPSGNGAFDGLLGAPLAFTMSYEHSQATQDGLGTAIDTGPVTLQFGGTASAALTGEFAPAITGQSYHINVYPQEDGTAAFGWEPPVGTIGSDWYQMWLDLEPVAGALDPSGFLPPGTYIANGRVEFLESNGASASGPAQVTLELR